MSEKTGCRKDVRPRVGDECWFVAWCSELAFDSAGDVDWDRCTEEDRRVATREEAERLAREVYPRDQFGSVSFWPAQFRAYDDEDAIRYPHVGYWEDTADMEYYEGEDA